MDNPCKKCITAAMCLIICQELNDYMEFIQGRGALGLVGYKFVSVESKRRVLDDLMKNGEINDNPL